MFHTSSSSWVTRRRTNFVSLLLALLLLLALFVSQQLAAPATQAQTWNLVWEDNFDGSGAPNSADWNYNVGNGRNSAGAFEGWGNGEWEWYRPENCYKQNGSLVLRADWLAAPMNIEGRNWGQKSCRLTTDGHRSWKYGKLEARIAMPTAAGSWPAFWMMGDECNDSSTNAYNPAFGYADTMATNWASCGEIDIMEHKNGDTTVVNNVYWDNRSGLFPWSAGNVVSAPAFPNAGNPPDFRNYTIEWDSTSIRWYINGVQTHSFNIQDGTKEEFHRNFHIILNLALGGAFPATNPIQSQFPMYMYVDYVRVWQLGATPAPTQPPAGGSTSISQTTWYSIQNVQNNLCLDGENWGTTNGTRILQWNCGATQANQHWLFVATDSGYYRIMYRQAQAQALEIAGGSGATGNGSKTQIWQYVGGTNQQWKPESMGSGIWRLRARHSNRCLDVPNGDATLSLQLQQWDCNGSNAQNFRLIAR